MKSTETDFLYVTLVLPSLFAIILILEGVQKLLRKESGWLSVFLGVVFLIIILVTYFFVLT